MLDFLLRRSLFFIRFRDSEAYSILSSMKNKQYFSYPTKDKANKFDLVFVELEFENENKFFIGYIKYLEHRTVVKNIFIHKLIELPISPYGENLLKYFIYFSDYFDSFALKLDDQIKREFLTLLCDLCPTQLEQLYKHISEFSGLSEQEKLRKIAFKNLMDVLGVSDVHMVKYWEDTSREITVYEDKIVARDAIQIPEFEKLETKITGKTEFVKEGERISVYLANKTLVEEALGVDLVYVNEVHHSIIMVQYKMLKFENEQWVYRVDHQFNKEIERMDKLNDFLINNIRHLAEIDDYRLNSTPFFLKFVKSTTDLNKEPASFVISLEHFKHIKNLDICKGVREGVVRIDYSALSGRYLRSSNFMELINSGYIGTYRIESEILQFIIDSLAEGNRDFLLAWKR
ncbi:hypothetical protein [Gallibacterium anatis]|uniref:hypothetical protein n=1 Tax=Gallibacterium anatis TaxID=750 RepID=UPI003007915F